MNKKLEKKFFYKSNNNYKNNQIISYYKTNEIDTKFYQKKHKYGKLLPFYNESITFNDIKIVPYNYYNNMKKYKKINTKEEDLYKKLYEYDSTIYENIYKKKFKYDIQFI